MKTLDLKRLKGNMLDGFAYCKMLYDGQGNPADFVYLDVNRAFVELTGLENVVGRKVTEVVPGIKESSAELFEIYGRVASTGQPEKFEIEIKPLRIWFSISAYSPANGYFVALFDNITERKQGETALLEEKKKMEEILSCVGDGIGIQDRDMNIVYQNAALEEMVGSHSGARCYKAYEGNDAVCEGCPVAESFEDGKVHTRERHVEAYGRDVYVEITSSPLRNLGGKVVAVIEVVRDVTSRRKADEAVKIHAIQQAGVAELGQLALKKPELSILFERAVVIAAECLGVEYSKILELLPDGSGLLLKSGVGWKDGYVGQAVVGTGVDSQAGFTLLSKEPVVVEDLRTETRFGGPEILVEHGVVSGISALISGKDRPFGVLGAHTRRCRSFSRDDINFIQSVANVLAEAAEKKKYEIAFVQRNERLAMLNRINKAMVSTLDLDEIFGILVENLAQALGMESGVIFLYDDINNVVNVVKSYNFAMTEGKACFPVGNMPLVSEVIKNDKPVVLNEVGSETEAYKKLAARSMIVLPLSMKGLVQGVICLHNELTSHTFSDSEIEFAMQVADQAMIAIVNAKLVKSLTDNDTKLLSRNRQLSALNEVASIIASHQGINVMLQMVLEMTLFLPFLEVTKGIIFLRDEKDPAKFNMAAHVGLTHCAQITSGQCLCGVAAESGEIIFSSDCSVDPRYTANYAGMEHHRHVVLPIKSKDGVLGVMNYYLEPGTAMSDAEIHLLTSISNQLATGILNRRFLEKIAVGKKEWESTFDAMEEIVTIQGADYTILRANMAASRYLGKRIDNIVGRKCYEIFHGAKEPLSLCPAKELFEGLKNPVSYEVFSDGKYFEIHVYPVFVDGQVSSFIHIAKDITERKRVENALKESEEQFRNLVEQSLVGVYIIQDEIFRYINPRFADIFGYTPEEIIDIKSPKELVYPKDWPLVQENILKGESGDAGHYSFRGLTKTGKPVHVEVHASQIFYLGKLARMGTLIDITETILARDELVRKTQEAVTLRHARMQSEEVNRLKSEFLANMSHELRTPLNAVIGLSQVLIDKTYGPLVEKQEEYLCGINQSGQHLIGLINEILDLSKIEAGKEQLEFANFSLKNLLNNSFIMIKEKAMKNNIELIREIDSGIGMFHADERRIKQIIYNLLSNAVKFTNPGGKVGLKALSDDELTITVWDTGIGIPENKKHQIFQPFQLIDSSLTRRHEGTGLGLVLTKKLVELHHGRITFESMEGKGTSFTIVLPTSGVITKLTEDDHKTVPESLCSEDFLPGKKIMIVEDNSLNMLLAADYLKVRGAVACEAFDGVSALEKADAETPDLILMDIQMPGMDGFEVLKRLKLNPKTGKIPVIAMTALAMKADQEKCLNCGFDDYISKPVNLREMLDKIHARLMKGAANE